ncbi:MAG: SCO family protein [Deltaproteobacteria bacterium]|nr:SCO family protein [Deltaproteobacteria bacterium]
MGPVSHFLAGTAAILLAAGPVRGFADEHKHHHEHAGHKEHMHHHGGKAPQEGYKRSVSSYEVPDVTLRGPDGAGITLREALGGGNPVMLNFIFTTCPTICPLLTASVSKLRQDLGADRDKIRMVSITIDPEYDTPAVMKEYANRFSADSGWMFLTGSAADIVSIQHAFDAYRGNKMKHAPYTYLRASHEISWTRLDGILSAEELEREARSILTAR